MREILFRGQTQQNNWVYGGIFHGDKFSIIYGYDPVEKHVVYSDTVGQWTGLYDKNKKRAFEGDIIKTHYANAKKSDFVETIVFRDGRFCAELKISPRGKMYSLLDDGTAHLRQDKSIYMNSFEVVGNIYDNPELLEVQS